MATETLRPNAAGDYTGISSQYPNSTAHWDKVDEASADEDTTYVYSVTTTQQKDAYALADTAIPSSSTINSVKVYFRFRRTGANWGYCQPFLRLGTDETAGTNQGMNTTAYVTYNQTLARPGGGVWSVSDLNSLQVAIGIYGASAAYQTRVTQVSVEVDYTPAPAVARGCFSKF